MLWTARSLPVARTVVVPVVAFLGTLATVGGIAAFASGEEKPFVEKWGALGSGCPKDAAPVGFHHRGPIPREPRTHVFRFTLPKQKLASPAPTGGEIRDLAYGRECSLRVVLQPPRRTRIVNVVARSSYRLSKGAGVEGWILSDLQLGNRTIAKKRVDFGAAETIRSRGEEILLVPGRSAEESLPESACGQGRILGLDTIFSVSRTSLQDSVDIALGEGGAVEIVVELAPC